FLAYFVLAAAAVQLFRNWPALLGAGLGLVLLGIGIEYAQASLTATRMAEARDALANTLGVIAGLGTRLTPLHDLLLRLDGGGGGDSGVFGGGVVRPCPNPVPPCGSALARERPSRPGSLPQGGGTGATQARLPVTIRPPSPPHLLHPVQHPHLRPR